MANDRLTKLIPKLALLACLLTFCVMGLGAYTRLIDAGLGCPDWPGCYGNISVTKEPKYVLK